MSSQVWVLGSASPTKAGQRRRFQGLDHLDPQAKLYRPAASWTAAGSFLGQTVLPILCALLLLMLVMLGKARHNVVKETAYVEQQFQSVMQEVKGVKAELAVAKVDLSLGGQEVQRCTTTRDELQRVLAQAQAQEALCLQQVSKCSKELTVMETKLARARRQLEGDSDT